jgi:hypothetical protein
MKQKLKAIFKGPVVFYPILFAAFPILFLYVYNISQTSASEIWLPIVISVAVTVIMWIVLTLILHSLTKAGFATSIFLVFFFSYGRFYDVLVNWGIFEPNHAYLLPAILFVWGICVYFIGRTKRDFRITTRWLNVAAVVLIAINLFNIVSYQISLDGTSESTSEESPTQTPVNPGETNNLPDIYFIVMDEYAHPDTMLKWYDYDNSEFINSLEDKGFFIATESQTPIGNTERAIGGVLNMEDLTTELYAELSQTELFKMIAYNKAADFLQSLGYQYIYFGNVHDFGRWYTYMKDSADLYFNYYEGSATPWVSEFQEILWNTTMLRPFYYKLIGGQYEQAQRRQILYTLEHIKTLPEVEGPKFVVAHLYCPHQPFVFGPEGQYISSVNWANYEDKQFYLGQYIFISREIEKVVDALLEKSEIPPIIILQSDHGLRPHHSGIVIGPDEWRKILNAMYLPGMDTSILDDNISPVNTFRLIFNNYFDADYLLLEEDEGE